MARIDFAIGPDSRVTIHDEPTRDWPDRRHAWVDVTGEGSRNYQDAICLRVGSYGCPTDLEILAAADLLIGALSALRRSAVDRIAVEAERVADAVALRAAPGYVLPTIADNELRALAGDR